MKRMIAYEEFLDLKKDVKDSSDDILELQGKVETLEGKNFYTISIEDNSLIIALDEESDSNAKTVHRKSTK